MRERRQRIARLSLGVASWLAAGALMGANNWDLLSPTTGTGYTQHAPVGGYGKGPANSGCAFRVTEHSLGDILAEDPTTTDEFGNWTGEVKPPTVDGWPLGSANAVLSVNGANVDYATIEFR